MPENELKIEKYINKEPELWDKLSGNERAEMVAIKMYCMACTLLLGFGELDKDGLRSITMCVLPEDLTDGTPSSFNYQLTIRVENINYVDPVRSAQSRKLKLRNITRDDEEQKKRLSNYTIPIIVDGLIDDNFFTRLKKAGGLQIVDGDKDLRTHIEFMPEYMLESLSNVGIKIRPKILIGEPGVFEGNIDEIIKAIHPSRTSLELEGNKLVEYLKPYHDMLLGIHQKLC